MAKMFNEEMAPFYEGYYKDKGVHLLKEDQVTGFEGDGKVQSKHSAPLFNDLCLIRLVQSLHDWLTVTLLTVTLLLKQPSFSNVI